MKLRPMFIVHRKKNASPFREITLYPLCRIFLHKLVRKMRLQLKRKSQDTQENKLKRLLKVIKQQEDIRTERHI